MLGLFSRDEAHEIERRASDGAAIMPGIEFPQPLAILDDELRQVGRHHDNPGAGFVGKVSGRNGDRRIDAIDRIGEHDRAMLLRDRSGVFIARHHDDARARGVRVESEDACQPDFAVKADPVLLEIVLDNLLGNAVAYVPAGGSVGVRAMQDGIEVRNAAPALHAEDLAHFGRRFWRMGTQGPGHAGLGLALAAAASRALKMTLAYELHDGVLCALLHWSANEASNA